MTVKEVMRLIKVYNSISLGYGESAIKFNKEDALAMEAYGSFIVDEIRCENGNYEVNILMRPVREGCA